MHVGVIILKHDPKVQTMKAKVLLHQKLKLYQSSVDLGRIIQLGEVTWKPDTGSDDGGVKTH